MDKIDINELFQGLDGALFVQPYGPNTAPELLRCYGITDGPNEPRGAVTPNFCPSPLRGGGYRFVSQSQGPPEMLTMTVQVPVGRTSLWLERELLNCPTSFMLHLGTCGTKGEFGNFELGLQLQFATITNKGPYENALQRNEEGEVLKSFALVAVPPMPIYHEIEHLTYLTTAEAESARSMWFGMNPRCFGPCGADRLRCDWGMIVYEAGTDAVANVEWTRTGGALWTTAVGPFPINEHNSTVVGFEVGRTGWRWIVGNGVGAVGAQQVAWTDDWGVTWNVVAFGGANDFLPWTRSLYALDRTHIWAGTDDEDIWFSGDGGLTWTAQYTGAGTDDINAIKFLNYDYGLAVGVANTILFTEDGGTHWTALTGPPAQAAVAAMSCEIFSPYRYQVGYADGTLWYTHDGGTVWVQRLIDTNPTGHVSTDSINDIMYVDQLVGFLVTTWTEDSNKHAAIYRTVSGGFQWEVWWTGTMDSPCTHGFATVWACGWDHAYAAGCPISTLATIVELAEY